MKENGGGRTVFFPDVNNESFNFTPEVGVFITDFNVEGRPSAFERSTSGRGSSSSTRVLSVASSVPPCSKKSTAGSSYVNVKIAYATVKKKFGHKLDFKKIHQSFFKILESTANVHYLTQAVREKWGGENLILVTNDGMPIEDGSGTQGEQSFCTVDKV